eukprot:CAMPEP_0204916400 /NCGR_PEP_ID=MMETSP1397-20131031/14219_1 /ASSEMBLY_ACC=CAM_ASM_000891 /TAXON_ID=49980 /ORGANISM="Climacostomum Climacostomum virens, Strain Stock W-24" /LENGTH=171 /DNA_ID=CAMNT_0052088883 /DNA_START=223 /DNA_END=734 /DNA_ORIENTATION=-
MYLASAFYVLLAILALAIIHKRQQPSPQRKTYKRDFFFKQMTSSTEVPADFVPIMSLKKPKRFELRAKRLERFEGKSKVRAVEERPDAPWISFGSFGETDTYEDLGTRENSFMASPLTHELDMSMFEVKSVLDLSHDSRTSLNINAPAFVPKSSFNPEVPAFVPHTEIILT